MPKTQESANSQLVNTAENCPKKSLVNASTLTYGCKSQRSDGEEHKRNIVPVKSQPPCHPAQQKDAEKHIGQKVEQSNHSIRLKYWMSVAKMRPFMLRNFFSFKKVLTSVCVHPANLSSCLPCRKTELTSTTREMAA